MRCSATCPGPPVRRSACLCRVLVSPSSTVSTLRTGASPWSAGPPFWGPWCPCVLDPSLIIIILGQERTRSGSMVTLHSGHPNANKNMDPRQHLTSLDKICTEVEGMALGRSLSVPNPKNQHWTSGIGHKGKSV